MNPFENLDPRPNQEREALQQQIAAAKSLEDLYKVLSETKILISGQQKTGAEWVETIKRVIDQNLDDNNITRDFNLRETVARLLADEYYESGADNAQERPSPEAQPSQESSKEFLLSRDEDIASNISWARNLKELYRTLDLCGEFGDSVRLTGPEWKEKIEALLRDKTHSLSLRSITSANGLREKANKLLLEYI